MDFPIEWTLDDARFVAGDAFKALQSNSEDRESLKRVFERGTMFTDSLRVLNSECIPELTAYRESIVFRRSKKAQEEELASLYEAYCRGMSKEPFRKILTDFRGFLKALFT
jgi:hypothetical protein